jgi:hypothetical protein
MEIYRGKRGSNNAKFWESEYFVDEFDYRFQEMEFTDQDLCNGDENSPIEFKFINRNQYKMENTEIGHVETTLANLFEAVDGRKIPLISSNTSYSGMNATMQVVHCEYENVPTFTDYRGDGYDISLIGAIDFTYSNGLQNNPSSLHHISDKN